MLDLRKLLGELDSQGDKAVIDLLDGAAYAVLVLKVQLPSGNVLVLRQGDDPADSSATIQKVPQKTPFILLVKSDESSKRVVVQSSDPTDEDALNQEIVDALIANKLLEEPYRPDYIVRWENQNQADVRLFEPDRSNPPILSFSIL